MNLKGGYGNNYVNDFKMEYEVRNNKGVLKGMCGNKILRVVLRFILFSYMLNEILM